MKLSLVHTDYGNSMWIDWDKVIHMTTIAPEVTQGSYHHPGLARLTFIGGSNLEIKGTAEYHKFQLI